MVREDESKKAEQELNRIRKLPDNKRCANCLEPGHPLLTAVVMPFKIFVCSNCKSAHQSFSHRCKSTQMSLWTMEEVRALEDKNGGGNRAAQESWLANVRSDDRPREGDSLDRFKSFVQRAYIDKRWDDSSGNDRRRDDSGNDRRRDDRDSRRKDDRESRRRDDSDDDRESRRRDDGGDSRSSRRDRDSQPRSSQRDPAPALSPPSGATSRAVGSSNTGRRREDDGFNPDAVVQAAPRTDGGFNPDAPICGPSSGAGGASALLDDGFDPNASTGKVASGSGGLLDFFDPNAGSILPQATGTGFDPFGAGGTANSAPSAAMPGMQSMPFQTTQMPAGPSQPFDPFASNGGLLPQQASQPSNTAACPPSAASAGPGMGMPGMAATGGYTAAFGRPPYPAAPMGGQNMPFGANGMTGAMPNGMPNNMPNGMPGSMSNGMTCGAMPNGMPGGMQNGMPGCMPNGMPGAMSNGMPGAMSNGMPGAMSNGMPGAMSNGMPGAMPNGMPGQMSNGMPGAMPNGMPGQMSNGMTGAMPNGMQGAMPNGMQGGMPGMMCGGGQFGAAQQGFAQMPQQPQVAQQQQAPRLEDLQQSLNQLYAK